MFSQEVGPKAFGLLFASFLAFSILWGGAAVLAQTSQPDAGDAPSATLAFSESRVAASTDDAEERNVEATGAFNIIDLDNVDLDLVRDGTVEQVVGMRFTQIKVPREVTITNAYIQFTARDTDGQPVTVKLQAEAVDSSLTYSISNHNISSRPLTAAAVSWSPEPWREVGEADVDQRTPNLSSLIQEIIDRPGWDFGNAISIIVTAESGLSRRTAISYDNQELGAGGVPLGPIAAPLLFVEYEFKDEATPEQLPPEVDAGEGQVFDWPINTVTLTGTVTDDGLPNPPGAVTILWSKLSGPGDVTFGNASALKTTATFSEPGIYFLRLVANDGQFLDNDEVRIRLRGENPDELFIPNVASD